MAINQYGFRYDKTFFIISPFRSFRFCLFRDSEHIIAQFCQRGDERIKLALRYTLGHSAVKHMMYLAYLIVRLPALFRQVNMNNTCIVFIASQVLVYSIVVNSQNSLRYIPTFAFICATS